MTTRTSITKIAEKHPGIELEYENSWVLIVESSLDYQFSRNSKSSCVRTMKKYVELKWPYLNPDELSTMVDRISGRFNSSRESAMWDKWRNRLPNVFNKDKIKKKEQESHNKISKTLNISDILEEKYNDKKYYTVSKGDICIGNVSEHDLFNVLGIVSNYTK